MSKQDNNIDELGAIREILEQACADEGDYEYKTLPEKLAKLDEHYKKKYLALVPEKDNRKHAISGVDEGIQIGFNMAIDEMTNNINQFNSRGDNVE